MVCHTVLSWWGCQTDPSWGRLMFQSLLGDGDRFVAIDVETTGLYNSDRVVEVAAVTIDPSGHITDEWDTLVDPQRDVGPTHIHGVTASMVSAAPRFEEIAGALANRLFGAVLVAHNLAFDARMLTNEYTRVDASFSPGSGVCTLRLGGGKLEDVCRAFEVNLQHAHRALGDARATAQILSRIVNRDAGPCSCARVFDFTVPYSSRTLRREMVAAVEAPMPYLARLASHLHHYGERGAALAYLDLLDWALADLVITDQEQTELSQLAGDLGLDREDVARAHRRYLDELVAAAMRDHIVTDEELDLLHRAAAALSINPKVIDEAADGWRPGSDGVRLLAGMRVCFTGSAIYPDGSEIPRKKLNQISDALGLELTSSVTKSACDLLVAADASSQSGKANKARMYEIPVVGAHDFLLAQPGSTVPAVVTR